MKIYVDKMPVQVRQRVIHYDDGKTNCVELEFAENVKPTEICDTQSLKQQVRAEAVEKIKNRLAEQRTKMQNETHCYPQTAVLWQDIVAILDQVKGENHVKD